MEAHWDAQATLQAGGMLRLAQLEEKEELLGQKSQESSLLPGAEGSCP